MTAKLPLVVGIGASAGGVSAISELLSAVPRDSGLAFVVVTHLSPDRESLLHKVLAQQTDMTVKVAENGETVAPDTVYVMPERVLLQISQGRLVLTEPEGGAREPKPIDMFFSALAEDQRENAAAIVLSGSDADGTLGVKVVKEFGGITFAQSPDGTPPHNPEMPNSAISTGLADFAIPVREMPAKLIEIRDGRAALDALGDAAGPQADAQAVISEILRERSGHDFSGYKSKTFLRRVARRMQVRQIHDPQDYCETLRQDSDEVDALFRDLLISVTNFFRDTGAFETLETKIIPAILENCDARSTVRVWVPACATGEEVYSLAILFSEAIERLAAPVTVQIFATDIDDPALAVARQGRYPGQLLRRVSEDRLQRFFRREGAAYAVTKKLREMCVFSPHNVISDPPFSRIDLVSCRNLLIYFGPELQHKIIPVFHYALKPGGYLFLGTSENINRFSDLFNPVNRKHRIFQAKDRANRRWTPPDLSPPRTGGAAPAPGGESLSGHRLRHRIERHILEHHTPAHAVVRQDGKIVFVSAGTGEFLELPRGAPSLHLLDMVPKELRLELRASLRQSADTLRPAIRRNLAMFDAAGQRRSVKLKVEPLRANGDHERLFIVFFEATEPAGTDLAEGTEANNSALRTEAAEQEVHEMRERLQSTVEEYETALEELKSSNEELVSVNQEAQSSNEELQASKEEMQSLNEELNTINAELNVKLDELDRANSDLRNLFEATRIATVFLDADLGIRSFTPAAGELFHLRAADIGRPLTDLASVSDYPELQAHIGGVFETAEVYEHRLVRADRKTTYLVRISPYLGHSAGVEGAVVTLVDVSTLARAEEQQKVLIAELNHRVKNMLAVIIAIVKTSLRGKAIERGVLDTLLNRLHGMARAYELLSARSWSAVGVRDIIEQELGVFETGRIHVSGANVELEPTKALALGMVIHELATNAVKYGALSNEDGAVRVGWTVDEGRVALDWRETGGPATAVPEPTGFGLVLIKGQIEQQLDGELETTFGPEGLTFRMAFPA